MLVENSFRCGLGPRYESVPISRRIRRAVTLLELLVVIAIIGVLSAALLPAVQSSRESGRRLQCTNHLKQIGLGFQLHHDAHRTFPSGGFEWWTPPGFEGSQPLIGARQPAGWPFQLLPFLESRHVWQGGGETTGQKRALVAIGAVHPVFFCPSRRDPQAITYVDPFFMGGREVTHGLCDYAASNMEGTGIVRQRESIRAAEVTDGLSNTLFAGDKRLNVRELGNWQEDDNEGYTAGWDEDTIRRTERPPAPDHTDDGDGDERFGSSHPQRFNIVLGDGSVRGLSYVIDPEVFQRLGQINDGNVIGDLNF